MPKKNRPTAVSLRGHQACRLNTIMLYVKEF
jgi:hypothetical protein